MEGAVGDTRRSGIALDALILVLVTGLTLHRDSFKQTTYTTPAVNAVAVGLLGLYLALDVLGRPLQAGVAWQRRTFYGGKSAILAGIIALAVLWPTLNMIGLRHASHPWLYVHDTSINVEEATKYLLAGKDPYAQTYLNTPLAQFPWHSQPKYGYGPNPALWLTDTFPGQELITVPVMLAANATLGWFDERFVYLVALGVAIVLLLRLAPTPTTRLAIIAGVCLNPLWITEFIYGQNDILVLAELLAVVWLSLHSRWRLALLALAIGCATKQTTLILVPFYLWWLGLRLAPTWRDRLERLALLLPWLAAPFILMVGPFAAWNWPAFYDGNFGYVAGTVAHSYPIQGYDGWGAASFALWSGLVPGPNAYFPFWIWQAAAAVPLTILLVRRITAATPMTVLLGMYGTVLFPIFYFSRFFHESYAAFTIALLTIAYLAHRATPRQQENGHISLDVIVPLLLIPQLIAPPTNRANGIIASLTFGLLLAYIVVAALAPWTDMRTAFARRYSAVARAIILAGLAETAIYARGIDAVTNRLQWNAASTLIHDTALQIGISAGDLLKLRNPYTITFWNTPLPGLYIPAHIKNVPTPHDLPLTHNAHLPLGILIGAPLQGFFNWINILFDERYVYFFALLVAAALLPLLTQGPARQLALLSAVAFSPLFANALMLGQDDILVLVALIATLLLLRRERYLSASLALGMAVALKLTAWPLLPLALAYLIAIDRSLPLSMARRIARVALRTAGMLVPLAASTLPFIKWNGRAFWNDAIAYPLGLIRDAVPLNQYWGLGFQTLGFGRVALTAGWAHLNGNGYIGPWLALLLGGAVLGALIVRLWRAPSLPLLVGGYLVLLFTLEYFGRFMIDTSLGFLAILAPLAFFLPAPAAAVRVALVPVPEPETASDEAAVAV